jgi:putative peptidoglycan lipid II flippase
MSADESATPGSAATEPEPIEPAPPATESLHAEVGIDVAEQSLARPAAVMAVGTALSRLTGLGKIAAMAYALGVTESRVADSYNLANTLPNVIYELVLGGVLSSVFIPVIVQELRTKDNREAWRSVSSLVTAAMTVLIGLTLVTMLFAPQIIDIFTSRVGGSQGAEQQELASFLLRVFAIQVTLYGFVGIAGGLLNSHGRFAVPMFAPIVNNLFVIGSFIVFAQIVSGVPTDATVNASAEQKWLLALGTTGGVAAMALVFVPFIRQLPGRLTLRVDMRSPAVRKLARLAGWTMAYVVTNVLGFVVSFYLANQQQGGITAYVTAFAFFQVPIGLAAVPIATALMPKLSAHHVDRSDAEFRVVLARGIRVTALLMLPATALYLALADPLIELLLQHGIVGGDSARLVASTLQFFAIGLLPFALFQLFTRAFYARQNARLPAYINVVENGVSIVLDFALFPLMDVRGLALAHTLGYVVGAALAAVVLRRELGPFGARHIVGEFGKALVAAALMCGAMLLVVEGLQGVMDSGDLLALAELALGTLAGLAVFALFAKLLRIEDTAAFRRLMPARLASR